MVIPKLLLIPLITGIISQLAKVVIQAVSGTFSIRKIHLYGGMPSTHTAIASSVMTVIGLQEGASSPAFVISSAWAVLVVRDAIGFRRYIGNLSRTLNRIVQTLPQDERRQHPLFRERLGHTPLEAFVGSIVGFCLSAVLYLLLP